MVICYSIHRNPIQCFSLLELKKKKIYELCCVVAQFEKIKMEKRETRNKRGTGAGNRWWWWSSSKFTKMGRVREGDFELRSEGGAGAKQE